LYGPVCLAGNAAGNGIKEERFCTIYHGPWQI
jgi:hypothetical protein